MKNGEGEQKANETGRERTGRILKGYIRQYWLVPVMLAVTAGIFAAIFSLYELETEAVLYAFGLSAAVLAVAAAVHFSVFVKRHQVRMIANNEIALTTDRLPPPVTLVEEDYRRMVDHLREELADAVTAHRRERQEAMDYYTTWVHQIKTPISVMRMLISEEDTERNRALMEEVFRIEQYVEMVLSYLRLGSDTTDYVIKEYDLDAILRDAVHKYAPLFVRKRIRLDYEQTAETVITDRKWLDFIICQIFDNAIKYTPKGSVSISVCSGKVLKISDTGIGIEEEDLPRIFEKGFTGYNGRAGRKSTGLGLYLCKMAADNLNHRLWAESKPGMGTSFYLDLSSADIYAGRTDGTSVD